MFGLSLHNFVLHLLAFVLAFGPLASVTASPLEEGDCAPTCGCDSDEEPEETTENVSSDEHDEHDDCNDECSNCDCKSVLVVGVVPLAATPPGAPNIAEKAVSPHSSRVSRLGDDIFIPPRR